MKNFLFLSLAITFFLIPYENARVVPFGVPIYFVEIGVMASAAALFFNSSFPRRRESSHHLLNSLSLQTKFVSYSLKARGIWIPAFARMTKEKVGIFFLLVSVSSSIIAATSPSAVCPLSHEGLLRALGILKSWFVFPMLFGYILFHASRTYFSHEKLIFTFLVSFLPISILSLLGWLFGSGMTYDGRLAEFFNSPNALAMYLTPAVILSWYFFRSFSISPQTRGDVPRCIGGQRGVESRSGCETTPNPLLAKAGRNTFWLSFFIFAFLLFLTRSYSAWIAISIALFFFEIMRMRNIRVRANNYSPLRYATIFLLFAGIVILSQWNNPRFENFFDPDSRSSFASRIMIWQSAGKMIADSPVFGIGPGNFQSCYLAYQKYFPPYLEWSVPEPHNLFLAFWLGGGLVGLSAFSFLLLSWFRNIFRRIQKEGDGLLLALVAIMIATLVHGLFDTTYWRLGISYLFWIVFFLGIQGKSKNNDSL